MAIEIDDQRRESLVKQAQSLFLTEFDEELSDFRAVALIDFFLDALGPPVYNKGVQDARAFMAQRLEDLEGDVYEPEV